MVATVSAFLTEGLSPSQKLSNAHGITRTQNWVAETVGATGSVALFSDRSDRNSWNVERVGGGLLLSLINMSEPTRLRRS